MRTTGEEIAEKQTFRQIIFISILRSIKQVSRSEVTSIGTQRSEQDVSGCCSFFFLCPTTKAEKQAEDELK
jgi:hypothetical protein